MICMYSTYKSFPPSFPSPSPFLCLFLLFMAHSSLPSLLTSPPHPSLSPLPSPFHPPLPSFSLSFPLFLLFPYPTPTPTLFPLPPVPLPYPYPCPTPTPPLPLPLPYPSPSPTPTPTLFPLPPVPSPSPPPPPLHRLPWSTLLDPVIDRAYYGFKVTKHLAKALQLVKDEPTLKANKLFNDTFRPGGNLAKVRTSLLC